MPRSPLKTLAHLLFRGMELPFKPLVARYPLVHRMLSFAYWEGLHHLVYSPLPVGDPSRKARLNALNHVVRVLGPPPLKVLELGCGEGGIICGLVEKGYDAYGLEVSPRRVEACRRRCGVERCWVGDMLAGPARGVYDVVLSYNAFFYLHPHVYSVFLRRWRKRLRPGGRIVILHNPCLHRLHAHDSWLKGRLLRALDGVTGVYHALQGGFWVDVAHLSRLAFSLGFQRAYLVKDPFLAYRCGVVLERGS